MLPTLADIETAAARRTLAELISSLPTTAASKLLGRALQRHRTMLLADPSLSLPVVYALCWFSTDEQAALRTMLRGWSDEWSALRRGPWLRSLRPPALPLEAPLLEEYPGAPGPLRPWFSTDGEIVGGAGEGSIVAWSRASGQALTEAEARVRMPTCTPPRYEIDRRATSFDTFVVRDVQSGSVHRIAVRDEHLGCVATLSDGDIVAGGWFYDYDGVVIRAAPATGEISWRVVDLAHQVDALSVSPDQSRIVAHSGSRGHGILSADTGALLAHCPSGAGAAALSDDNRLLAVWSGSELQVWSVESAWRRASSDSGLVSAEFSPNGTLLLCGHNLYDGISGGHIARVDVESSGYLEGGPAAGCTQILDDGLVEAGVFHGMQRWDARGEVLWQDENLRYHVRHSLRFSRDGAHYTVVEAHRGGPVEIREVVGGALVHTIERATTDVQAWSPDGRTLATAAVDGGLWLTSLDGTERRLGMRASARALVFSWDGAMLAVWDGDRAQVWNLADGRMIAERRIGEEWTASGYGVWTNTLHEWSPFRLTTHGRTGHWRASMFEVHDANGRTLARFPTSDHLVPSPDGKHWAGRGSHFVLEGG